MLTRVFDPPPTKTNITKMEVTDLFWADDPCSKNGSLLPMRPNCIAFWEKNNLVGGFNPSEKY